MANVDRGASRAAMPIAALAAISILVSCASALKSEKDLGAKPVELNQKIEDASGNLDTLVKASDDDEEESVASSTQKSASKKKVAAAHTHSSKDKTKVTAKSDKAAKNGAKANDSAKLVRTSSSVGATWRPKAWPYGVGEKIVMVLRYGVLEGGIATLEVKEPQLVNGVPSIHFVGKVKSSRVLELFYHVDDQIDSWVGIKDHLPRRQEIRQLESSRWGRRVVVFDLAKQMAKYYANTTIKDGNKIEEIRKDSKMTPFAQDVFGALYFYRFVDNNTTFTFPIHDRWKNWSNELTFLGRERIHVPAGSFDTLHFKMFPRVTGQLEPKGDVELWIKDDPTRVMVQFKAKIKVGAITGELKEYVPGRPFNVEPPLMKTPTTLKP